MRNSQIYSSKLFKSLFILLFSIFLTSYACADEKDDAMNKAIDAAKRASIMGPAKISLLDQAVLDLPENYSYVPAKEGAEMMHAMGNTTSPFFRGLVINDHQGLNSMILITYTKSGRINADSKNLDSKQLLSELKRLSENDNERAKASGFPTIDILGWGQAFLHNTATHKITWATETKQSNMDEPLNNYVMVALGREGFFLLTFTGMKSNFDADKDYLNKIFSALHYNNGKRYEDFVSGKDKSSTKMLPELITGS